MAQKKNRYLLEFMSIVFAVTLALVLDEWRQSVKDDKLNKRVLNSIKAEVLANLEQVEQAIPYRESLIQELREGRHIIVTLPLSDIPLNINDDNKLANYLEEALLSGQQSAFDRTEIRRVRDKRFLILDDNVWRLEALSDSLKIFGSGNIQLRGGQIANNAWQLSQATQVMVRLPFKLVELLAQLNSRQATYTGVATQAIEKIYSGDSKIQGVLQDMLWMERQLKEDYENILVIIDEAL
ncbi:MAG: hypothetical protein HEP71_03500 [Roseivirga sp.]|nr:hypothetical protein [Roseivirga sp.]